MVVTIVVSEILVVEYFMTLPLADEMGLNGCVPLQIMDDLQVVGLLMSDEVVTIVVINSFNHLLCAIFES